MEGILTFIVSNGFEGWRTRFEKCVYLFSFIPLRIEFLLEVRKLGVLTLK
jgi:hypothetical protein